MDYIRLALERSKSAKIALELMINLLATYGQGGNCSYEKKMHYHNSYIIADKTTAYVLETAGQFWVNKEVKTYHAISNGLTIENDFDECHPELIVHAISKKYCKSRNDFNFARSYGDPLFTKFARSKDRTCLASELMADKSGSLIIKDMMELLRTHQSDCKGKEFSTGSMGNLCMHGGGLISSQTTASLVANLSDKKCEYYYTGASLPCVSIFKPFTFDSDFKMFSEEEQEEAKAYWRKRETLVRMFLFKQLDINSYRLQLLRVEDEIHALGVRT